MIQNNFVNELSNILTELLNNKSNNNVQKSSEQIFNLFDKIYRQKD